MLAWLRRVARSAERERFVLRGSLLTAAWCPGRLAADVDHLLTGTCDLEAARAMTARVAAEPDPSPLDDLSVEPIWADTPFPGLRVRAVVAGAPLQVDLGWGDPLAVAPRPFAVAGVPEPLLAVRPETMIAWKVHGLFEHGRGRFRAKDLLDVWLLDRAAIACAPTCARAASIVDDDALVASLRVAFDSRGLPFSAADRFVSGEWGRSRGSRRKWDALAKKGVWAAPLPAYDEVLARVRARVVPLLARAAGVRAARSDGGR